MPITKNPGPLLQSRILGSVDNFPREFLASVGLDIFDQEQPKDVDVDPILGLLIESKVIQTRTDERKKTNTYLTEFPDGELFSEVYLQESGMTGMRARKLVPIGTPLLVDGLTESADQNNLGNGWMDQVIVESPEVYHGYIYGRERGLVTPEDFRALLQEQTFAHTEDGQPADPGPLPAGVLSITDQEDTIWQHRLSSRFIDLIDLPAVNLNEDTNEFKQVVDVRRTLELDTETPALPTSTKDTTFTKLGDGTALQVEREVDEVFSRLTSGTEILDVIPEIFKAVFPIYTKDFVEEGIVDDINPPVLDPGDLERVESQIDVFNKRTRTRGRGVIGDTTRIALRRFGGDQYGGEVTQVEAKLDDDEPTVDEGYEFVSSVVRDLGNGQFVRETEKLDTELAWPILLGQEYDETLDVVIPFLEQTIEAATFIGVPKIDIKPQDKHHSKARQYDTEAVALVLDAYLMTYPSKTNVSMPDILTGVSCQIQSQTGDGADSEVGEVAGYGNYSINLDLRADATASASIIPELFPAIKQFYGPNVDCTHFIFFLPNPVTSADVLTKVNDILDPVTVSPWPKFNPRTESFFIVGENSALKVNAVSKGSYSQAADLSSQSSTSGGGTGYSRAKGLTIKRMQISPTIHGDFDVTGTTTDDVDLTAACDSEAVGLGPFEEIDLTDTIGAFVSPTSLTATPGATTWPTTGKFLYRVDAKPYRYGYVMFHVIVVDAADFPSNP